MGGVHGGWALTLIDSVGGCAGHSLLPAGSGYTTIETKGNFARPINKDTGRVRAEARVVAQGRQGSELLVVAGAILILTIASLVLRFASRKENLPMA